MDPIRSHPVFFDSDPGSGRDSVRYDPAAFGTAQAKLKAEIEALESLAERLTNSADAMIGSIQGPTSSFEACKSSLNTALIAEICELTGMIGSLGESLKKMRDADLRNAIKLNWVGTDLNVGAVLPSPTSAPGHMPPFSTPTPVPDPAPTISTPGPVTGHVPPFSTPTPAPSPSPTGR